MDAASVWLARYVAKKLIDDRAILLNTLAGGGVQDRYQFICGQINIIDKVLQIIKEADPDERPKFQDVGHGFKQQVY